MNTHILASRSSLHKSSNGCWTCRLRRKKCDEHSPICNTCATLHITCHYQKEKPDWMDGGSKQEEMSTQLKREVRANSHLRLHDRPTTATADDNAPTHVGARDPSLPQFNSNQSPLEFRNTNTAYLDQAQNNVSTQTSFDWLKQGTECAETNNTSVEFSSLGRADTILITYYLEHLFPSLYPFYRPSIHEGGRSWILELMVSSPALRRATLCQSSYFFSLSRGTASSDEAWEVVLKQTQEAFYVIRSAIEIVGRASTLDHLSGAVRIITSIIQIQRFEVAILSFQNCRAHLNAALALFKQMVEGPAAEQAEDSSSAFVTIMGKLGPATSLFPAAGVRIPSAEQTAFRFSTSLLILDDIIASMVLQEQPRLYEYHRGLLNADNGCEPLINLEAIMGCQSGVLLQIGEIVALDAWKQQCKQAGNLDLMDLVNRAKSIKYFLETRIAQLEHETTNLSESGATLKDIFMPNYCQQPQARSFASCFVTRIWAHAALLYLYVVVSGWQTASVDVRHHVSCIVSLLTTQVPPPALLRTMVWPFCIAGCLAEPPQEASFRHIAAAMQHLKVFGSAQKALAIMESAWSSKNCANIFDRDLASCFQNHDDLVLLV